MKKNIEAAEPKRMNKIRIAKYIAYQGIASRPEISHDLNLSMPTTMQHVKELLEAGIIVESGTRESTGGRKAKALIIAEDVTYACGVDITRHHISLSLVNARKQLLIYDRVKENFRNDMAYFENLENIIRNFLDRTSVDRSKIAGIGFSLPGFVDKGSNVLTRSDVLQCCNISFQGIGERLGVPFAIENDANSAAYAEFHRLHEDAVYLSLSGTVGGAIYYLDSMYEGHHSRSAEFGHMIIEQGGRTCYCGKQGCVDAYCNADILQNAGGGTMESFFSLLKEGDRKCREVWDEYLEYLGITVANLRMIFDCDIYMGGYVGGYLSDYLPELGKRVQKYNRLDLDTSYIKTGKGKLESSAYGVSLRFIDGFFDHLG